LSFGFGLVFDDVDRFARVVMAFSQGCVSPGFFCFGFVVSPIMGMFL
jgi:hypothetical protein